MAYTKTNWVARQGANLNKFTKSQETAESVLLTNTPDSVTQEGTPFSPENMNKLEDGVVAAHEAAGAAQEAATAAHTAANAAQATASAAQEAADVAQEAAGAAQATASAAMPKTGGTFTGAVDFNTPPTMPTADPSDNSLKPATTAFVKNAIAALVASSPTALDTLNEIAAALGNDPNFATTIINLLAGKAPLNSPALTGMPTAPTAPENSNNATLANTEYVDRAVGSVIAGAFTSVQTTDPGENSPLATGNFLAVYVGTGNNAKIAKMYFGIEGKAKLFYDFLGVETVSCYIGVDSTNQFSTIGEFQIDPFNRTWYLSNIYGSLPNANPPEFSYGPFTIGFLSDLSEKMKSWLMENNIHITIPLEGFSYINSNNTLFPAEIEHNQYFLDIASPFDLTSINGTFYLGNEDYQNPYYGTFELIIQGQSGSF